MMVNFSLRLNATPPGRLGFRHICKFLQQKKQPKILHSNPLQKGTVSRCLGWEHWSQKCTWSETSDWAQGWPSNTQTTFSAQLRLRGGFFKMAKGSENVCTVEAQTGTCLCVQWFMVENVRDINLSSRTSLTTIPIYVTWWFMERKWKQSGSLVCMYCCAYECVCVHVRGPSDSFSKC